LKFFDISKYIKVVVQTKGSVRIRELKHHSLIIFTILMYKLFSSALNNTVLAMVSLKKSSTKLFEQMLIATTTTA
jgi:hypothetical protein